MPSKMFQSTGLESYSPTTRLVMNAGATMNSTTPSTSPSTIETAISFFPNPSSEDPSSPTGSAGTSRTLAVAVSGSGSQTTSNVRCAPSASIISSGFPKSSFQENFFSSPPGDAAPSDWKENAETSASEDAAALSGADAGATVCTPSIASSDCSSGAHEGSEGS